MSDTCSICSKPIENQVLIARYEGWEKHFHPVCFAKNASAENAALKRLAWALLCAVGDRKLSELLEHDELETLREVFPRWKEQGDD